MCTHDGNTNRGCYLPPDTYNGIVSGNDHPGYLVRQVTTLWTHLLWCYYLHLSGAYVCFTTQGRLFYLPKPYFFITIAHNLRRLVYKNLQYPSLFPKI